MNKKKKIKKKKHCGCFTQQNWKLKDDKVELVVEER